MRKVMNYSSCSCLVFYFQFLEKNFPVNFKLCFLLPIVRLCSNFINLFVTLFISTLLVFIVNISHPNIFLTSTKSQSSSNHIKNYRLFSFHCQLQLNRLQKITDFISYIEDSFLAFRLVFLSGHCSRAFLQVIPNLKKSI